MPDAPIFTIGYGARDLVGFLSALTEYGIGYLVDVRSYPESGGYKQDFARSRLEPRVGQVGVRYLYMGDVLGGRPADGRLYVGDVVDYEAYSRHPAYRSGVDRLLTAYRGGHVLAIMCAEGDPSSCHRTRLVGESLFHAGAEVAHILPDGATIAHADLVRGLDGGQLRLFGGITSSHAPDHSHLADRRDEPTR